VRIQRDRERQREREREREVASYMRIYTGISQNQNLEEGKKKLELSVYIDEVGLEDG
jgi:hypothetical protein